MIQAINLKDVALFNDEGVEIDGFKKANFIYGANGCGKTTISNLLHDATDSKFDSCSITWKDDQPITTLVYNKDFRERNFGKGKMTGVFTIGQATKKDIEVIENKTVELKGIKEEGVKKREVVNDQIQKKNLLEENFTNYCWVSIYKKYEKDFKESFIGSMRSKELFKTKLLQEFNENTYDLFLKKELDEKAKTIFGDAPEHIQPITTFNIKRIPEIESNVIWKKIIVGKADVNIAKLIQKLNINDWVNEGRGFIQDDEICPFCQEETITANFKDQLESFFDEDYTKDLVLIKQLRQEYDTLTTNLLNHLNGIENNQKILSESKLEIDKYSAYLKTIISQVSANNEILNNKVKEPSRSFELISLQEQLELLVKLVSDANAEILKHNKIVANFQDEKLNLIKSIWKYLIEEFRKEIEQFNTDKLNLEKGIANLQLQLTTKLGEYSKLESEIKKLSKNVTSIQPTIDEINRILKSYGFINFEIVPASDDGFYQIQREDGTIADTTLSEGEITFITFLYYLQLAKGGISEESVNDERVLVIDDPISSLDSNILFVVSTLIKEIIKAIKADKGNIKQIILLTHNVYFHKEVSYEGLNRKGEKSLFWILRKNINQSTIHFYDHKNPIQSSYELLWREIKEWKENSGITIQNTMRRIIENYFSILGNKRDDFLIAKFETNEEQEICRSLLSWINEGSHTMPDDLYVESPEDTIQKYLNVFREIFIHTDNLGHYNMMMGESDSIESEAA